MDTAVIIALVAGGLGLATLWLNKLHCTFWEDGEDHKLEISLTDPPSDSD